MSQPAGSTQGMVKTWIMKPNDELSGIPVSFINSHSYLGKTEFSANLEVLGLGVKCNMIFELPFIDHQYLEL